MSSASRPPVWRSTAARTAATTAARDDGAAARGLAEGGRSAEEGAVCVARVLGAVGVQDQRVPGAQCGAARQGQFGGEREEAERWQDVTGGGLPGQCGAHGLLVEPVRPGVAAVERGHLAAGADLQQQDGHELLAVVVAEVAPQRAVQPPEDTGEFGLLVGRLAEAAEHGGDGADGGEAMAAYVPDDGADAVRGGQHLVQIAAERGAAAGRQGAARHLDPVQPGRQRPQHHLLCGGGHFAGPLQLADQPGAAAAEHVGESGDGAASQQRDQRRSVGAVPLPYDGTQQPHTRKREAQPPPAHRPGPDHAPAPTAANRNDSRDSDCQRTRVFDSTRLECASRTVPVRPDSRTTGTAAPTTSVAERARGAPRDRVRPFAVRRRRQAPRSAAPVRSAARATAASRAAAASSTVSVRSGARKRSAYARDFLPSPSCSPV